MWRDRGWEHYLLYKEVFEGTRAIGSNVVRPGQLAAFQTRESKGGDENEELEQDETLIALGDPDSVGLVGQASNNTGSQLLSAMASFGASQPPTPRTPPPATSSQRGSNTSIPKRLRGNTQDSLLLRAGVLKDSNDLAAAQGNPAMH